MKRRKWILIGCIFLLGVGYLYLSKIDIKDKFILNSTAVNQSQLPQDIGLNITIVKLGFGRAIVYGTLEDSKEIDKFNRIAVYDNKDNIDYMRLSCLESQGSDYMRNRYIHIELKNSKVLKLELIEALTSHKTSKTESEVGVYSLKKLN